MLLALAVGIVGVGCAEGVPFDPTERGAFLFGLAMPDAGAVLPPTDLPAAGTELVGPDAGVSTSDPRETCDMGEMGECVCPETNTMGMRRCLFDDTSPTGGFFDDVCRGCAAPSCTDGVLNGAETDVDCGGADCPPCADGMACTAATDCEGGLCTGAVCRMPDPEPPATGGSGGDAAPDPMPEPAGCEPSSCPDCGLLNQPCCSVRDECGCNLLGGALLCN